MSSVAFYEWLGYVASVLIAVSLMMSAVVRLRVINLIGAFLFACYGVWIQSMPVLLTNGVICLINVVHLYRIIRAKEYFKILEVPSDSPYLHHFLHFYEKQIRRFQPAFNFEPSPDWLPIFVLRDAVPAGLVLGTRSKGGCLRVHLDFAIPQYRDFKIARFLFASQKQFFLSRGLSRIETARGNRTHQAYLERMGFAPMAEDPDGFFLELND